MFFENAENAVYILIDPTRYRLLLSQDDAD
jgi:hypothetical protein